MPDDPIPNVMRRNPSLIVYDTIGQEAHGTSFVEDRRSWANERCASNHHSGEETDLKVSDVLNSKFEVDEFLLLFSLAR